MALNAIETWRVIYKGILLVLWSYFVMLIWQIGWCLLFPFKRARLTYRLWMKKLLTRGYLRFTHMKVTVRGLPPKPPYFMVCNHLGYMDIIVLSSIIGGVYVPKKEVGTWPIFGRLARWYGCIFIDRDNKKDIKRVLSAFSEVWQQNDIEGLILFAEGTSGDGQDILPFMSSLFLWPAKHNMPVYTASLAFFTHDPQAPARTHVCWWEPELECPDHFKRFFSRKRTECIITFNQTPVQSTNRKELCRLSREAMLASFVKSD